MKALSVRENPCSFSCSESWRGQHRKNECAYTNAVYDCVIYFAHCSYTFSKFTDQLELKVLQMF